MLGAVNLYKHVGNVCVADRATVYMGAANMHEQLYIAMPELKGQTMH
jgi:hypothetical protein